MVTPLTLLYILYYVIRCQKIEGESKLKFIFIIYYFIQSLFLFTMFDNNDTQGLFNN